MTGASGTGTPRAARAGCRPGECREHPRARAVQRPPAGDWRTWLLLMGRGAGKTRSAAEWVRHRVETGAARRIALVGATAADVRDVMVEGQSGILAVCPPWDRPRYEPSKRRLTWPNGARGDDLLRRGARPSEGPAARLRPGSTSWRRSATRQALDNLLFGLRLGKDPRLCVTTTPKPVRPGDRADRRPDDGDRPGHDLREPGPPGGVVLRADRDQVRGDPAGPAGAAGGDPRGLRRGLVPAVRPGPARDRGGRVRPGVPGAPGDRLRGLAARGGGLVPGAGGSDPPQASAGDGLRRLPRRGPVLRGGAAGRSARAATAELPGRGGGSTWCGWTRRRRRGRASGRRPTASSSGSSAPGDLARWPGAPRRSTASTSSRSCSTRAAC